MNAILANLSANIRHWCVVMSTGAALVAAANADITLTATSPAGSSVLNPGSTFAVDLTWSGTSAVAAADYAVTLNTNQIACTGRAFDAALSPYADTPYLTSFPVSTNRIDATWFKAGGFTGKDLTLNFQIPANYNGPSTVTIGLTISGVQDAAATDLVSSVAGTTIQIANSAPTISDVADQVINEDSATSAIPFTVGDIETAAASLTVAGTSSNTTLVPNANIVIGGSGASRTVTVTPAANQYGTATITLTVNDGSSTSTDTFLLTVLNVNDPPTITDVANQTIYTNGTTGALAFTVGDLETAATSLVVTGTSSNTSLVPDANVVLGGSGTSRTVTVTPVAGLSGSATITLTVSDGALTATDTFVLTVSDAAMPVTGSASDSGTTARTVNWITNTATNWLTWDSGTIPGTGTSFDTANVTLTSTSTSNSYIIDFNQNLNLQNLNLTMKGTVDYLLGPTTGTRRTITWNNNGSGTAQLNYIQSSGNPLRNKYLVNSVLNTDLEAKFRFQGAKDGQFGGIVSGPGKLTVNYASNVNNSAAVATSTILIGTASDAASTHTGGTSLINSANNTNTNTSSLFTWKAAKTNAFGTGMLELSTVKLSLNSFDQTVGGLGGGAGSSIIMNGVAGTKTLTLDFGDAAGIKTFSGAIQTGTGEVALTKKGTGTQVLTGTNTYLGATNIIGGSLLVNGSLASGSAVTVGTNGTLGGTGTVSGAIGNSGTIAPGASVGTLTAGAVTMAADSKMQIEVTDWNGSTPGTGWDWLNCASLTLSGSISHPIVIKLTPSNLTNFVEETRIFTIATSAAAIAGYDPNGFTVDGSAMPGAGVWSAYVDSSGKQLQVMYLTPVGKLPATVNLTGLAQTYDGTPKAASCTTDPAGLAVTYTYDGSATVPTNAGTYVVVATVNDPSYEGTATGNLVIGKATAAVNLTGLTQTYDGTPKAVSADTVPVGLTVNYTYDGSPTAPTNAGSYAVVATVSNANYQGGATGTLVIQTEFAAWQKAQFTQAQINAGLAASDADPDHDGSNNLIEFAFNGDPLKGSSDGLFVTECKDSAADGDASAELVFTCAVRRGAVFTPASGKAQVSAAIDGVIYTVEGGADPAGPWDAAIGNVDVSNTPPAGSGLPDLTGSDWEYRTFSAFNGTPGKGFIRVKVTAVP